MATLTESQLKKQILSGDFSPVYLLYGSESYLKHYYYQLLLDKVVDPAFADFNLHIFDAPTDMKEIALAAEALPRMRERTCIVLKDLKPADLGDDGRKALLGLLGDLPETCVLLICALTVETDGKGWKELIAACDKHGSVLKLDKMSPADLARYAVKGAQSRGCTLTPSAANYFITVTGDEMTHVLNELEKVCAYVGEGEITRDAIDAVTVRTAEVRIFELSRHLISGSSDKAFAILHALLQQREEPVVILGTIITAYVDMYRAKVALAGGKRPEDMAKVFAYGRSEFRLRNGAKNAAKMTIPMLRESLRVLSKADETLKSTSIDQRIVLEEMMIRLLLVANGEHHAQNG